MSEHENVAYVIAQAACLVAETLGMHAENMQREHCGQSMAYVAADFQAAIEKYGCHHNAVLTALRG